MPFTNLPQTIGVLNFVPDRYEEGDDNEFIEKSSRKEAQLEAWSVTANTWGSALGNFVNQMNDEGLFQARLAGRLVFDTKQEMDEYGQPPNYGTPLAPWAEVGSDDDNSGIYSFKVDPLVSAFPQWTKIQHWSEGKKGDIGPAGVGLDGKSAYQLAQDGGFTGTVTAWLDSLVGPKGPKGEDGVFSGTVTEVDGNVTKLYQRRLAATGNTPTLPADPNNIQDSEIHPGQIEVNLFDNLAWLGGTSEVLDLLTSKNNVEISAPTEPGHIARLADISTGLSAAAMLGRFGVARWWLAPQDGAAIWENRGAGPTSATADAAVTFNGGTLDFRPAGIVDGSPVALGEIPFGMSSTDVWTMAIALRIDTPPTATTTLIKTVDTGNTRGFDVRLDSLGGMTTAFVGSTSSASSVFHDIEIGVDMVMIFSFDGPSSTMTERLISENVNFEQVTDTSTYGDMTPVTPLTLFGASDLDGQLGDFVIEIGNVWTDTESTSAATAMAMRLVGKEDIARQAYETGRRKIPKAGQGLTGEGQLEVFPDNTAARPYVPVDVGPNGVSLDARRVMGVGFGAPIDRRGQTAKVDFGAAGTFIRVDSPVEVRPVVASHIGYETAVWNSGATDVDPYGATGVTLSTKKTIKAGEVVVFKAVAVDEYLIIGAAE